MAGKKGKSGGDHKSAKFKGIDLPAPPPLPETRIGYDRLIAALNANPITDEQTKDPEAAGWRKYWDMAGPVGLNARKFLYAMRDGTPVQRAEVSGKGGAAVSVKIITTARLPDP